MVPTSSSRLFTPLKLGKLSLKHRVIMAPLTRTRSPAHIPTDTVTEYYRQRAADGGLLITEATFISVIAGSYVGVPGIYTPEQVRAWRKVTAAVHEKGGYIYCQLWHVGRTTHPDLIGGRQPLSSSAERCDAKVFFTGGEPKDMVVPKEMTEEDLADTIEDYVHAAKMAMAAGFDGVEVHCANGYLLDQFLADNVNKRTDKYGGSRENRSRFPLAVVDAVVATVGADRVGVRFSPFGDFQGMDSSDPVSDYGYIIGELDSRGLAYVHIVEPRSSLVTTPTEKVNRVYAAARARGVPEDQLSEVVSLKPFRKLLKNTPLIGCGEFSDKNYQEPLDAGVFDAPVFGRYYISNPDLPERLKNGWPLTPYNRSLFYTNGPEGYTDYPTYQEQQEARQKL